MIKFVIKFEFDTVLLSSYCQPSFAIKLLFVMDVSFAATLWNQHIIYVEENRQFVDCKLLDEISGKEIPNKFRRMENTISEMVAGTDVQPMDLIRKIAKHKQRSHSVCVAARTMQLIILRGFKEMPWNEIRRSIVKLFFPPNVMPDVDPYKAIVCPLSDAVIAPQPPSAQPRHNQTGAPLLSAVLPRHRESRAKRCVQSWTSNTRGGSLSFWRHVFWFVRKRGICMKGLVEFLVQSASLRKRQTRKGTLNIPKALVFGLMKKRGTMRDFCDNLAISMKTGNMEYLIDTIRKRLNIDGLKCNIVPSIRSIKTSTQKLIRNFIAICKPERTHSGFKVDLVSSVKLAVFLCLRQNDLVGIPVDIWGDAAEIGGLDVTRMTFRLLCGAISAQSANAVFCFATYRGKDSRFTLEQNMGPSVAGEQETGWLYQQTLELQRLGAKLTYSGDTPFLLRLIMGISNEKNTDTPSLLPLYVSESSQQTFLPTTCHALSGRRTDLSVPFRKEVPKNSLVCATDVRCICPDTTHMIIRNIENDLRRMGQKICDDKHPFEEEAIRRFEENLTAREAKKPKFQFTRTTPTNGPGQFSSVSLSGTGALTVIADTCELQLASTNITDLFEGVWDNELVIGTGEVHGNCVAVLKEIFPELFTKVNPIKPNDSTRYITTFDASELLRSSLNKCVSLLRASKEGLDVQEFNKWAETYYQTSLLLFGEKGLTPYKLKMMLFPTLVESGYIQTPWYHMCEGLEKSNHHAHKDFQTRTMRGGGSVYHQDPLFLELFFSYAKLVKLTSEAAFQLALIQEEACEAVHGVHLDQLADVSPTYLDICQKNCHPPIIAVGDKRKLPFIGLRFYVIGTFGGTQAARQGKLHTPVLQPQPMVEHWISTLGGEVYTRDAFLTLFHSYSRTPNCFIVLKDDTELLKATMTAEELAATKSGKSHYVGSTTDHDSDCSRTSTHVKRVKLSGLAKQCRVFAGGDMTFIKYDYIIDSLESEVILDPYSDKYRLTPGSNITKIIVNDVKPLLMEQISGLVGESNRISAIVALKKHRRTTQPNTAAEKDF